MPPDADALASARAVIAESLAVALVPGYASAALIQYNANVTSAWTKPVQPKWPARLSGATQPARSAQPALLPSRPFSLSGAKTNLSVPNSHVVFVMTVPDVSLTREVAVDLDYVYDEVEFDIAPVVQASGYEASNWLSFMPSLAENPPPALHTTLGAASIPIPLRAFPATPAIQSQSARATYPSSASLSKTPLWSYGITYVYQHAAQDEVRIAIETNIVPLHSGTMVARDNAPDIVRALAAYSAAADGLWALLPGLIDSSHAVPEETLANAAASFATLASGVDAGWALRWPMQQGVDSDAVPRDEALLYRFRVRINYSSDDGLDTLILASEAGAQGPGGVWPTVTYTPPGGDALPLTLQSEIQQSVIYRFPRQTSSPASLYPAGAAQCLGFEWPDINVASIQNARAKLSVRRNERLLGEHGPASNADFVLQTPDVTAAEVVWPLLVWQNRFEFGAGSGSQFAASLEAALAAVLIRPTGQSISLAASYAYELVAPSAGDQNGVIAYLPVKLQPSTEYGLTTASNLAEALETWRGQYAANHPGGEWAVTLHLNSTFDAAPGSQGRPLLQIARMIYRLDQT
jgi:hypothetical protein